MFALIWQRIWPKAPQDEKCAAASARVEPASTKTVITGALLLAALVASGHADEPASASNEPIYRVFVPVDDQRQPVGDTSYLPKPLYDELYRRATPSAERRRSGFSNRRPIAAR